MEMNEAIELACDHLKIAADEADKIQWTAGNEECLEAIKLLKTIKFTN